MRDRIWFPARNVNVAEPSPVVSIVSVVAVSPLRIVLALAEPGDIVHFLEDLTVLRPALDDLDAVKVGVLRVLHRPHHKGRRFTLQRRQVTAHRHAFLVPDLHPVLVPQLFMTECPAAEQPHLDAHAAGAEGLLALHGGEDRLTRILFRPHATEAGRGQQRGIQAGNFFPLKRICGVASVNPCPPKKFESV